MDESPQSHYLNSDFDVGLRPRLRLPLPPKLERQVRELSVQSLLGARPGDAALIRAEVSDEFVDYLGSNGLPVPRLLIHPRIDSLSRLRPFGWSAEAIELNRRHKRPEAPAAVGGAAGQRAQRRAGTGSRSRLGRAARESRRRRG